MTGHIHGPNCGHTAVVHDGHIDFLVDGRLETGDGDEHILPEQSSCLQAHPEHEHGPDCGHEMVIHGDHEDYLVDGFLHHPHEGHCDNHGPLTEAHL